MSQLSAFNLGSAPWGRRQRKVDSAAGGSGVGTTPGENDEIELQRELDVVTHPLASSGSITELPVRGVMRPGQIGLRAKEEGQTLEPTTLLGMNPMNGINGTTGAPEPLPADALAVGGTHGVYSSSEPEFPEVCGPGFDGRGFAGPRYQETPDTLAGGAGGGGMGGIGMGIAYDDEGESDVDRVAADLKALNKCKMFFILGIFGLPFIHLLNAWHFRRELIGSDGVDTHPQTRQYARGSLLIAVIWLLAILTWYIIFRKVERFDFPKSKINILNTPVYFTWV